jgi:glycosyltransferase involved in cell wall biosynthesis
MMTTRLAPREATERASVSVVIPNYNYARYLAAAAGSALAQRDVDVDVVIVDNASTDDSKVVAERLMERDPRVRTIFRDENQGHIPNFNEALSYATGDYVTLLCADDLLAPGALGRSTALLDAHRDVAFAYGDSGRFTDEVPVSRTRVKSWSVWSGAEWFERVCRRGHTGIMSPEVVMRRSVMDRLAYDADNGHAADFQVWLGATRYGGVGRVNGTDQAFFRVHGANLHATAYAGRLIDLRAREQAFHKFVDEGWAHHGVPTDLWRAALAREALDQACRAYDRGRVEPHVVSGLETFARDVYADVTSTGIWRALQRRKRFGTRFAQYVPTHFAAAVRRRAMEEAARRHIGGVAT